MNAFLGGGGPFLLATLTTLPLVPFATGAGEVVEGAARTIEEVSGLGVGTVTALGAGGTLLLAVVALAVVRRVASLVVCVAVVACLLAWWAGWLS